MTHTYECSNCKYSYTEPSKEDHFSLILCDGCRNGNLRDRHVGIYGSREVDEYFRKEKRSKMLKPWRWF